MNSQFSQRVSDIIAYSKEEANRLRNRYIGPEHILLGMLRDGGGKAIEILIRLDIDLQRIKNRLEGLLKDVEDETLLPDGDIPLSPIAAKILKMCMLEARLLKSATADTEHVLLAILKDGDNLAATILEENQVDYQIVFEQISMKSPNPNAGMGLPQDDEEEEDDMSFSRESHGAKSASSSTTQTTSRKSSNSTPVLDNFGMDMTMAAEEGKLDPVVGREREIERLAQILSRRKKNNPVLIGEPGVGKSAIVEGLALRIVQKKVSRILFEKRVVMLDMASVVAGTKYRGQFEERLRSIINELQKNPDIILFIDEIHTIVGAGAAAGSMDAANMLKPALARGEIQCIGATTLDEYRKNIEKDGALERRFQKVVVEPTTAEETLQILKNIKDKYEDHHNVTYTEEALEACVKLSGRYITDRNFPDKAIDAMDEAGSRMHLTNISVPKEVEEQEELIEKARNLKAEAVKSQNFELAASYRDREKELSVRLDEMKAEWEARLKDDRQMVGEEEIANVISMMSGVPVQRMAQAEGLKLANMKEELQSKVIAQDEAIEKLTKAILRSRVGLKDPNRPIGTFMFLGPTGVGKTHLAKQLAKYMFGSTDALIRIDMSEYMEKYTVSRMIGAAPGYVGYEEGGQLTEKVRRKPYSIVLLDEIEKAHSDVFNILLQVLDEGRLTDNYGRTVDFKNTVIIMTSNIGTRQLKEFGRGVGFTTQSRMSDNEHSRSVIQKALNKTFAPEFLNRLDEIITFDQLSLEAITKIVDIELKSLYERIEAIEYKLMVDEDAKKFLASKGYDVQFGARPLKRAIQSYLEDGLSELIVSAGLQPGDTVNVSVDAEKDALSIKKV
ncbi:Clp protease ClpC [Bacteroides heparinolyticus]|uniref:ATP-dependent Clp protease ATP-binding subunit ClpC n=1 Tax=Prevotella heparinolytica TaxID=28113 RepID=A0A2R3MPZ0_9BACE|nr:ATP-dependent Clp protease ATP-binding subunit [Bacteroides heparinolyticus]AVM56889.1 Clp protease ClpC [Bacteroides heparinolyticus]TCO96034.1 ATP-dependent Clp protease ATP-binding subunit ClpC [Bacteroides heparinolyticus]